MNTTDTSSESHRLILRPSRKEDYDDIAEIMDRVYKGLDGAWEREQFESQVTRFPEGQICIEDNGKVVAAAISLIVKYSRWGQSHRYWDIVGNGYLTTHDPKGDVLYGVDVFVHPDYRDLAWAAGSTTRARSCARTSTCAASSSAAVYRATSSTPTN